MELRIFAIFLVLWTSAAIAHPIHSYVLPKEYYQRQNLPEIPGYIPVYIKHDDEPLPKWKETVNDKADDSSESKAEEHLSDDSKPNSEMESPTVKEPHQTEYKGKTKKVAENFQLSKVKESRE